MESDRFKILFRSDGYYATISRNRSRRNKSPKTGSNLIRENRPSRLRSTLKDRPIEIQMEREPQFSAASGRSFPLESCETNAFSRGLCGGSAPMNIYRFELSITRRRRKRGRLTFLPGLLPARDYSVLIEFPESSFRKCYTRTRCIQFRWLIGKTARRLRRRAIQSAWNIIIVVSEAPHTFPRFLS